MSKTRFMMLLTGCALALGLWHAPASAEDKPKDTPKQEETAKKEKAADAKTAKKDAKKEGASAEQPKEQK
jgi:hypothetical protein